MFRQLSRGGQSTLASRRLLQQQHHSTIGISSTAIKSLSTLSTSSWNNQLTTTLPTTQLRSINSTSTNLSSKQCSMGDNKSFPNRPFTKLMAANRGEIATRIMRAGTELGCNTVGIYSNEGNVMFGCCGLCLKFVIVSYVLLCPLSLYLSTLSILTLYTAPNTTAIINLYQQIGLHNIATKQIKHLNLTIQSHRLPHI